MISAFTETEKIKYNEAATAFPLSKRKQDNKIKAILCKKPGHFSKRTIE